MSKWSIVYEGALNQAGELFFPEKLNKETLLAMRKTMGPYLFANQYLNVTIPDEEQDFKKEWIRHYQFLPEVKYTFIFVDPAISLNDNADYTAICVVHVDPEQNWYVEQAIRRRMNATDTMRFIFALYQRYKPNLIGIEEVAYQKALIDFMREEMIKTNQMIPIRGVKRSVLTQDGKKADNSKGFRIRSLVPRFEYGKIFLNQAMDDLLQEYHAFPRGGHDDLLDSLSSIQEIVFYPDKPKEQLNVTNPQDPRYESQYIRKLIRDSSQKGEDSGDYDEDYDYNGE